MNSRIRTLPIVLWLAAVLLLATHSVFAQSTSPKVVTLTADGALNPAMAEYIARGIKTAEQDNASVVILQLNTPGGSIDLMTRIIETIRGSTVPVVVYVSPKGAMAGSAGTLITLAGHLAAMAPETTIGAASPVGESGQDIGQTEEAKVKNILKATVRTLTERRGPEAVKVAEDTIDTARAVSASEAKQIGLVDFIANDTTDLLRQLDGKTVKINNQDVTLHTQFAQVAPVQATFIEQILALLTNPNLVLVLMNVGVLALLIELSSPGGWVAGFIGVVCIALAVYGLGLLPVNWFGIIFLLIAFVLFILDIKAPTHGALTVAGTASFIIGALVLFNSPGVPSFQRVSVPLVFGSALFTAALFFTALTFALRAQRTPVITGQRTLVGRTGTATTDINRRGSVRVGGELWSAELAEGAEPVLAGSDVMVVGVEGLRLIVTRNI